MAHPGEHGRIFGYGIKDGRGYGPYGAGYYDAGDDDGLPYGPNGERLSAEYDYQGSALNWRAPRVVLPGFVADGRYVRRQRGSTVIGGWRDAFGALHTAGTIVLSAFGMGSVASKLGEVEANAGLLPEWAGGKPQQQGGQQQQPSTSPYAQQTPIGPPSVMVHRPAFAVVFRASVPDRAILIPQPESVALTGGTRRDGNGWKAGDVPGKKWSFEYAMPPSVTIAKDGQIVTLGDVSRILFCGGFEQATNGASAMAVHGLEILGAALSEGDAQNAYNEVKQGGLSSLFDTLANVAKAGVSIATQSKADKAAAADAKAAVERAIVADKAASEAVARAMTSAAKAATDTNYAPQAQADAQAASLAIMEQDAAGAAVPAPMTKNRVDAAVAALTAATRAYQAAPTDAYAMSLVRACQTTLAKAQNRAIVKQGDPGAAPMTRASTGSWLTRKTGPLPNWGWVAAGGVVTTAAAVMLGRK